MKKVFGTLIVAILISAMYTSCTPEALTNEDETEISVVDPSDDGQVDEEDHREYED